jgi:hypothetical protein
LAPADVLSTSEGFAGGLAALVGAEYLRFSIPQKSFVRDEVSKVIDSRQVSTRRLNQSNPDDGTAVIGM